MAAPKGTRPPNAGKGRPKGVVNKTTADVRAVIAQIANNTAAEVEGWLRAIKDPARRVEAWNRMLEYHIPKLSRTEMTGEAGGPLQVQVVKYADAPTVPMGSKTVPAAPVARS